MEIVGHMDTKGIKVMTGPLDHLNIHCTGGVPLTIEVHLQSSYVQVVKLIRKYPLLLIEQLLGTIKVSSMFSAISLAKMVIVHSTCDEQHLKGFARSISLATIG